jgi:hypothetical protein
MKLSIKQKVCVIMVVIIFITVSIIKLFLNKNKALLILQEMDELDSRVSKYPSNLIIEGLSVNDKLKNFFTKGEVDGGSIKDAVDKPLNDIKDAIMGPINKIGDIIKDIDEAFKSIPKRARMFRNAFENVDRGIRLEFINLGKSLDLGFNDIFSVIRVAGNCGIRYIKNLRTCMIWYVLDLIGTTIYNIFVVLPVFLVKFITGFNAQPYVDEVHKYINMIDSYFQYFTCGDSFLHFPPWVIKLCYSCSIESEVKKVEHDWGEVIPKLLNEPAGVFDHSGKQFKNVFEKTIDDNLFDH